MLAALAVTLMMGAPQSLDGKEIQRLIANGKGTVTLPKGSFRMGPGKGPRYHLDFDDLRDLVIDGTGTELILTDPGRGGIRFQGCRNVTLKGLSLRWETPPFTQGRVTDFDPNGEWYEVKISPGYPTDLDDRKHFPANPTGYLFDAQTRLWKHGSLDLYSSRVDKKGPDTFRFNMRNPVKNPVSVGDPVAFRGFLSSGLELLMTEKMRIEDVTLRNVPGIVCHEVQGEGGNYYRYKVTYGPPPAGATERPLMASNAGGFNSGSMRAGVTVENSTIEGTADDAIPIHGMFAAVSKSEGNQLWVNSYYKKIDVRVGEPVQFFDEKGAPEGEAKVIGVEPAPDFSAPDSKIITMDEKGNYYRLTLDRSVNLKPDYLAGFPNATNSGFAVRGNRILNNRARGILIMAANGVVENNVIDGSTIAGIVVCPTIRNAVAGYAENVIIRGNTIRNTGYATAGPFTYQAGAISVTARGIKEITHRNITIENNTFEDIDGINLLVKNTSGVTIRGNTFRRPMRKMSPSDRGKNFNFDQEALVYIADSDRVNAAENRVFEAGGQMKKMIVGPKGLNLGGFIKG
ncbi:MAG: hypothetical protein ACAH95_04435 [Fimbriimonas sp.]